MTVQPDFLDGRDDDGALTEFLDGLFRFTHPQSTG